MGKVYDANFFNQLDNIPMIEPVEKLQSAILSGNEKVLEQMLETREANISMQINNQSLLYYAITRDQPHIPVIRTLLNFGMDVNENQNESYLKFAIAAHRNTELSLLLLEAGANVVLVNEPNFLDTAVHATIFANNIIVLQVLLQKGVDPNLESRVFAEKTSPLVLATEKNNMEAVRLLLEYGADPFVRKQKGIAKIVDEYNAYEIAQRNGYQDIARLLQQAMNNPKKVFQEDLSQRRTLGETLLQTLENNKPVFKLTGILQQLLQQEKILTELHIKPPYCIKDIVETTNSEGNNPVMIAASKASLKTIETLLKLDANPNIVNHKGETALMLCILSAVEPVSVMVKCMNALITQGAAIHIKDNTGTWIIHHAISTGHIPVVECLLKNHARLDLTDSRNALPMILAIENRQPDMVRLLLSFGADPLGKPGQDLASPLEIASRMENNCEIMKMLYPYIPKESLLKQHSMFMEPKPEIAIPQSFYCPITLEIMNDPVLCILDGVTYEREAIESCLKKNGKTPTRVDLDNERIEKVLGPNRAVKNMIDEYRAQYPELFEEEERKFNHSVN